MPTRRRARMPVAPHVEAVVVGVRENREGPLGQMQAQSEIRRKREAPRRGLLHRSREEPLANYEGAGLPEEQGNESDLSRFH